MSMVLRVIALSVVGLVVLASPAAADPARPGDYTSEVIAVEPDVGGFEMEVFGGDSFLSLTADSGVEVIVMGYEGEPYLRFRPDGGVDENRNSTAPYLNVDRYARADLPPQLDAENVAELEPDWKQIASGHSYAWHDHRTHWMAPNAPPAVQRGETFGWNGPVDLLVDGTPVEVSGEITFHHTISPLPWLLGAVVVAAGLGLAAHRYGGRWTAVLAAGASAAAMFASWREIAIAPVGARPSIVPLAVSIAAAVLGVAAIAVSARLRLTVLMACAVALGTWGLFRFGVLANPILPTPLPFDVDRGITALAIAVAVALVPVTFLELSSPARPEKSD